MRLRVLLAGLALALPLHAQELIVGLSTPVTTLDPHFHNLTPNNSIAKHLFETLVHQDDQQALRPGLAESWRATDSLTWEVKLRKNVRWHDGAPFTAEDVLATLRRIPKVPNSPASFAIYARPIVEAQAADAHTLLLRTKEPHPLLPNDLATLHIIPRTVEAAATPDFNSGKAVVGTGPYKFAEYVSGDRVVLVANDRYWGKKPAFAKVRFRMITNSAARVAALLAGDVHMIEAVPTADIEKLKKDARVSLASTVSNRVIYLHMDSGREANSPFVTDAAGKPMQANPLRDPRVRKALSMMIDRNAIAARIMEGEARPAGQFLPENFHGTSKKLTPERYDPEGARKLLAAAGYPNGFGLTLHAPNNRYINDEKIAQAVAQFLTRGGVPTKVEAMPSAVFFSRGSKLEFSFLLAGWGAGTGENSSPLRSLVATFDAKQGNGAANRGRFSDAGVDALIQTALATIDDTKRGIMLAAATEKAVGELTGVIPVHYEVSTWGLKKGLAYKARVDQYTLAHEVRTTK